jgi:hypothetical protein
MSIYYTYKGNEEKGFIIKKYRDLPDPIITGEIVFQGIEELPFDDGGKVYDCREDARAESEKLNMKLRVPQRVKG